MLLLCLLVEEASPPTLRIFRIQAIQPPTLQPLQGHAHIQLGGCQLDIMKNWFHRQISNILQAECWVV